MPLSHLSRIKLGSTGSPLLRLARLSSSIKPDSLIPSRIARFVIQYISQKNPISSSSSKKNPPATARPTCISMCDLSLIVGV